MGFGVQGLRGLGVGVWGLRLRHLHLWGGSFKGCVLARTITAIVIRVAMAMVIASNAKAVRQHSSYSMSTCRSNEATSHASLQ